MCPLQTRVGLGVAFFSWVGSAIVNHRFSLLGNLSVTSIDVGACHSAALLSRLSPAPHLLLRCSNSADFLALKSYSFLLIF